MLGGKGEEKAEHSIDTENLLLRSRLTVLSNIQADNLCLNTDPNADRFIQDPEYDHVSYKEETAKSEDTHSLNAKKFKTATKKEAAALRTGRAVHQLHRVERRKNTDRENSKDCGRTVNSDSPDLQCGSDG